MLYETKKIRNYRVISLVVLICIIIIYVIISNIPEENYEITDAACNILEYYEYSDATECELVITFDRKCYGSICVDFYDKDEKLLSSERRIFTCDDNSIATITFFIDGKVDIYDIVSYDVYTLDYQPLGDEILSLGIIPFLLFIDSLFLSCREYEYNGTNIVVYAGFYHHYIKVNGKIFDEHNTIVSFTAIPLSCTLDDGTDIEVVITLTNRISLKINNRLNTNYKGKNPVLK